MVALAQALRARGHEAVVACPATFESFVRAYGIEHRELGEDLQAMMHSGGSKLTRSLAGMKQYFAAQLLIQAPRLLEISRGAHAIVGTAMAWSAPSVAQKLGIPAVELLPSSCAPSRRHPPPLMPWQGLPSWVNALLWRISDAAQNKLMGEPMNAARELLELPRISDFTKHLFVDTPCIIAADEAALPPDPAWEAQGRYPYSGFLFLDDPTPLDRELDAWLAAGDPPIYVGFGSMAGAGPDRAGAVLAEAIRATGRRCLVSAGSASLFGTGSLPEQFFVVRDAPHQQLFPRVAVAVHHGGSGTTAAALRAGIPQVLLPLMLDQFHHAHVLARAGLVPHAPRMTKVTAETLRRAIDQALALAAEPRRAIAEKLQRRDSRGEFIQRLEHLVRAA